MRIWTPVWATRSSWSSSFQLRSSFPLGHLESATTYLGTPLDPGQQQMHAARESRGTSDARSLEEQPMTIDHPDSTLADVASLDDRTQERAFAVRRGAAAAPHAPRAGRPAGSARRAHQRGERRGRRLDADGALSRDRPGRARHTLGGHGHQRRGVRQGGHPRRHRRLLRPVRDPGLPPRARRQHPRRLDALPDVHRRPRPTPSSWPTTPTSSRPANAAGRPRSPSSTARRPW